MQGWATGYNIFLEDIEKGKREPPFQIDALEMLRFSSLKHFYKSSKEASPTKTQSEVEIWVEWEHDKFEKSVRSGLIIGLHDGTDYRIEETYYAYLQKTFIEVVLKTFDKSFSDLFFLKKLDEDIKNTVAEQYVNRIMRAEQWADEVVNIKNE